MTLIILYLLSDISPWDYWNSFNDLKESVNVILNDHIIDCHKYRTTEEAHKYRVQNTNSLFIKSHFLDRLDYYDMYCMIILAIIHPTKVSNLQRQEDTET